jgi:uncharacterized protein YxjI
MNPAFSFSNYLLKRQVFALTGKLRFYSPQGEQVLYVEQKMFRLKEDIRVYNDDQKSQEILLIKARHFADWAAAYDVLDAATGAKIGVLRRKGWNSMVRDEWEVLDVNDQPFGVLIEDSLGRALLRRFLLGSLMPQDYDLLIGGTRVADLRQKFSFFGYEMIVDFSMDIANRLDRRLGIAGAILLAIIEGKQSN